MSDHTKSTPDHPSCGPYEACMVRFQTISAKLDAIHLDFDKLSVKISNGITVRLADLESHIKVLQEERARRARILTILQTVLVGVMIGVTTTAVIWSVKHYNEHIVNTLKKP